MGLFSRGTKSQESAWGKRIKLAKTKEERKEEIRGRKIARKIESEYRKKRR